MEINWEEAPEDATHYFQRGGNIWWLRSTNATGSDNAHWIFRGVNMNWSIVLTDLPRLREEKGSVFVKRPRIKQEERVMFTAKQLSGTHPHKQMKMYIQATTPAGVHLPSALGKLVKKFMANCAEIGRDGVPDDVDNAFTWADTPEGHEFWGEVNHYKPPRAEPFPFFEHIAVAAPPAPKAPKPVPVPKKVGWW